MSRYIDAENKEAVRLTIFRDVRNLKYMLWIMTRSTYVMLNFDTEIAAQKAQRSLAKSFALDGKDVKIDDGPKEITIYEAQHWDIPDPAKLRVRNAGDPVPVAQPPAVQM